MTVMSRHVQYSLTPKVDKFEEKTTLLYDVLKTHSRMDSKLQAIRELAELRGAGDQDLFVENDQDFHYDALLNTEFSDEPTHWSDNTDDVLVSTEFDADFSEYVTDEDVDDSNTNTDELIRALLQVKLPEEQDGGAETDFDVAYADSALIAAQVNTEDDFTTAYDSYYSSSKHCHNGAVLDSDVDIGSYEYDTVSDDDEDDDLTITQISTYHSNDDNEIDDTETTEETFVKLDVYNPDEDDVVLLVDQLLGGDDEILTLQGHHFLQL